MAGHQLHALAHHVVGDSNRLLGIAGIVADAQLQLLAEHAASGVDIGNRLLRTRLHLGAEAGILTGHRTGGRHRDIGFRDLPGQDQRSRCQDQCG